MDHMTRNADDARMTGDSHHLKFLGDVQTSYRLNTEFAISCDTRQEELMSLRGLERSHPMSS
jgi:hypothetical protein